MQTDVREISWVIDARLERGEVPGINFPAEWWPVVADVLRHAARQTEASQRHRDRFATLSADGRPEMPEGYAAPLDMRLTRAIAGSRARGEQGLGD